MNLIDPSYVRWLAAYHLSVARPRALLYSKWVLANLSKAASSSAAQEGAAQVLVALGDHNIRLRRSEEIPIFRALYRYETYYHLFGRNHGERRGGFRHYETNELFFCLFNSWEAEAVGCIDLFVRQRYEEIFNKAKGDLQPQNCRFRLENGIYSYEGSFGLIREYDGKYKHPPAVPGQSTVRYASKNQPSTTNLNGNTLHVRHCLPRPEDDSAPVGGQR